MISKTVEKRQTKTSGDNARRSAKNKIPTKWYFAWTNSHLFMNKNILT